MKVFSAFVFLLFTNQLYACPNFSGEYFNEEFGTYYSMSQDGCSSITYIYDEGSIETSIDGNEYLKSEYDVSVEEGKVLAHVSIFEKNSWKGEKLITNQRSETTYSNGDVDRSSGWSETFLNKKNDLVVLSHGDTGTLKTIDKRVK